MRIRVATLNVWGLPEPFAKDVLPRMDAIGKRLADLSIDIIAFQEVWMPETRRRLVAAGRKAGFTDSWHTDEVLGGGGLLVLSRLPILDGRFERFDLSGYPEVMNNGEFISGKGFAVLRLEGPEGEFSLITTHLHARYNKRFEHAFQSHRTGQIVQLASRVSQLAGPVVVLGDLNFAEGAPEYRILRGLTGLRDVAAKLDAREDTVVRGSPYRAKKKKRNEPGKRIDYIFLREGIDHVVRPLHIERIFDEEIVLGGERAAYSNHMGVMAELQISARKGEILERVVSRSALDLASDLLSQGRFEAEQRLSGVRVVSVAGVACAALAAVSARGGLASRRRFLKSSLRAIALAALAPGVGYSVLSAVWVPDEMSAFENAQQRLDQLATGRPISVDELPSCQSTNQLVDCVTLHDAAV